MNPFQLYMQQGYEVLGQYPASTALVVGVATLAVALKVDALRKQRKFLQNFGGADYRPAFAPISLLGMVFGLGMNFMWDQRFTLYKDRDEKDLIILEPSVWGETALYTRSPEVLKQVAGNGGTYSAWWKPDWSTVGSSYWGKNILSVNDVEWKKHRKVMQPAFNNDTYQAVWKETTRFFKEMVEVDKWPMESGASISFGNVNSFTQRIALYAILSCGFGLPMSWDSVKTGTETIKITEGIKEQGENLMLLLFTPNWILNLPVERWRRMVNAVTALRKWFYKSVTDKSAEVSNLLSETHGDLETSGVKKDIFSLITLASQQDAKLHLHDNELIGNIWVMIFAGHETTAGTLAVTFCYLAANKEEQHIIQREIEEISQKLGRETEDLPFEEYESLVKTRAAFVEALRLVPAANMLLRGTREDTLLQVPAKSGDGEYIERSIAVPKDTTLIVDMIGLQRNPRIYPGPHEFRPSRWYTAEHDEMFTQFSVGPRSCIGRKFALTEGTCFLAHVLKYYEVSPLLEKGESLRGWKDRVLNNMQIKMSLNVKEAPVTFRRR